MKSQISISSGISVSLPSLWNGGVLGPGEKFEEDEELEQARRDCIGEEVNEEDNEAAEEGRQDCNKGVGFLITLLSS